MFSAIVLTKTTRKLTLQMHRNFDNRSDRRDWWKWLAYGCFSERARTHSALESLVLTDIDSMDVADMKDFSAVLSSEHPEEFLFGSPHGARYGIEKRCSCAMVAHEQRSTQIGSYPVKFSAVVPYLRTFSDDGKSELVNVMIPGFGRCLVKRTDLVDQQKPQLNTCTYGVKSVTLKFAERSLLNARGGLTRLLAAIGSSLMF
ncbi:hypothetical protein GQ600_20907 [Phytophthora cactorum]|nr:hypothetical protein GQ600_20907 [Phytophthora cactorum]